MEINITWNICRICLLEESKSAKEVMRNLFTENKKLTQHIYEFSGIIMKPNDSLPDKICLKCLTMINNAVQFRKTCRASNTYLQSILERTRSASCFFKPERATCLINDHDEFEQEKMEAEDRSEGEHSKIEKFKERKIKKRKLEPDNHLEYQEMVIREEVVSDSALDDTIELEEIIEQSEEVTEQIFTETIENNTEVDIPNVKHLEESEEISGVNSENMKCKTSQLQKFYMNAYFEKFKETEEDPVPQKETEDDLAENEEGIKTSHEDLYYRYKEIKNENPDSRDGLEEEPELQHTVRNESADYYDIEEEPQEEEEEEGNIDQDLMLHLEENMEDNQAQVSSTVCETNEEVEYHGGNSNISNLMSDLEEEYIVDDIIQETNVTKSHTVKTRNTSSPGQERTSPIIFPKRKIKLNSNSQIQVSVCDICGNQFTNRNLLNIHMKVHYQEKNHQCELCFKRFITACNLQAHMRIHTGEKPFQCKYCGRRFSDRSSNLRHERTHTNEKPFTCAICGKTFSLATTLQNHVKVHTNERSYRCEPCGKSFRLSHHLKTHLNTTLHRSVMGLETEEN